MVCCGTSLDSNEESNSNSERAMLYFYDITSCLSSSSSPSIPPPSQPFLGIALPAGCLTNGKTKVFFDPRLSIKGVVLTARRAPKREKDPSDSANGEGAIYTPDSLPMFKVLSLFLSLSLPAFSHYFLLSLSLSLSLFVCMSVSPVSLSLSLSLFTSVCMSVSSHHSKTTLRR
jgi:hypothetical protein